MRNSIKFLSLFFMFSPLFLQINGCCTALGYRFGSLRDSNKLAEFNQTTFEILNVDPGTSMDIKLSNGDIIRGDFVGLDSVAADEYTEKYEKSRQALLSEIKLPQLYDSIGIDNKIFYRFIFQGFDYGCIKVKNFVNNTSAKLSLTDIGFICEGKNNCIESEKLRRIIHRREIPLLSDLVLNSENTEIKIPSEKFIQGRITEKYYGWLIGLSAGVLSDVLLFYSFKNWLEENFKIDWSR